LSDRLEQTEAEIEAAIEGRAERRRYALLQAAATIYAAMPHPAEAYEAPMVAFSVSAAEELLKRIERREKAEPQS